VGSEMCKRHPPYPYHNQGRRPPGWIIHPGGSLT
jgi:hypothetical protein